MTNIVLIGLIPIAIRVFQQTLNIIGETFSIKMDHPSKLE